jgi:hypothetical protein
VIPFYTSNNTYRMNNTIYYIPSNILNIQYHKLFYPITKQTSKMKVSWQTYSKYQNLQKCENVSSNVLNFKQGKATNNTCAEEKLDENHTALETSPRKLFVKLAEQTGLCVYQHDLQQNCCIYTYIQQIWYTNSPTHLWSKTEFSLAIQCNSSLNFWMYSLFTTC